MAIIIKKQHWKILFDIYVTFYVQLNTTFPVFCESPKCNRMQFCVTVYKNIRNVVRKFKPSKRFFSYLRGVIIILVWWPYSGLSALDGLPAPLQARVQVRAARLPVRRRLQLPRDLRDPQGRRAASDRQATAVVCAASDVFWSAVRRSN